MTTPLAGFYIGLFGLMWLAWILCWAILGRDVKATVRHEPRASRRRHIWPLALTSVLLAGPSLPFLDARFVPLRLWSTWAAAGAVVTCAGLLFAVWARVHLGRNWSLLVTEKQDHELITSGPYRVVRHPIYTGLLLGCAGTAFARGQVQQIVAVGCAVLALTLKLRMEERFMRARFGAAYDTYSERVAALVPFLI